MQRISIYDMDKTITRTATFGPFLLHAARQGNPLRFLCFPLFGAAAVVIWSLGKAGMLRRDPRTAIKSAGLALIAGRAIPGAKAAALGRSFADRTLAANCHADALARIAEDKAAGYRLVLASASNRLYVAHVAQALGFEAALCTDNRTTEDGTVHAEIPGPNCYAHAKLEMVRAWLDAAGICREDAHIRFYSDHVSDAPCLAFADEAFATNPHGPLRLLAGKNGWPILEWR